MADDPARAHEMEGHPSVEDLHKRAVQYDPHLSLATVYRTINILTERGLLSRVALGDRKAHYEDARGEHHDHLVDVETGKVVELRDPAIEDLLQKIAGRCGYHLVTYRLELFGAPYPAGVRQAPQQVGGRVTRDRPA